MADTDSNWLNRYDHDTPEDYRGIRLPTSGGSPRSAPTPPQVGSDGLNVPSKIRSQGTEGGNSQKDQRFTDTFFDIHRSARFPNGRPWTGVREYAANPKGQEPGFCGGDLQRGEYVVDEVGNINRVETFRSVWNAPWYPIAKYFKFNYKRKLISFAYDVMLMEEQRGLDDYYKAAAILGAGLNVRVDYNVMPSFQITAKLGYPTRFVPIAQAAIAGDPWLLGHIDEPNVELAKVLGINEHGMRQYSFIPEGEAPLVTPAQVIATPPSDVAALVKRLAEMEEQLTEMRKQQSKRRDQTAQARARAAKRSEAGDHAA